MSDAKRARTSGGGKESDPAPAPASTATATGPEDSNASPTPGKQRRFAMVCSSNMNRSMEAHKQLMRRGLNVSSFGVGTMVRLPAPSGQAVFQFGTPYKDILASLCEVDDGAWYRANGLLAMIERNVGIKDHPERWQLIERLSGKFDVVFCFEERVFEALTEDVASREPEDSDEPRPMHIINLEVTDNPEEAVVGAQVALDFCSRANEAENLEEDLPRIVEEVQQKYNRALLHQTVYL